MKKLFTILLFCLVAGSLKAQVLQEPTIFGTLYKNLGSRNAILLPTTCGVPTITSGIKAYKLTAIAYDSCGHQFYVYDPSDSAWKKGNAGNISTDSLFTTSTNDSVPSTRAVKLALNLKVDSVTTSSDSTKLIYWKNGASHIFYSTTTGLTGGDTTVFQTVVDTTGQPGQRVLWSANNKIKSDQYFLYDSARHKLVIGNKNISVGGINTKFYLVGNAIISGNITAAKHITTGGTSSQFVKGDGTLDGNTYQKTTDSLNVALLNGGKIDTSHIPIQNLIISNQGAGTALARGSNDTIYFKKIQAGTNVTFTQNADSSVTINSSGGSGTTVIDSTAQTGILKGDGHHITAAVSGTDIKTINGSSILGGGNLAVTTDTISLSNRINAKQDSLGWYQPEKYGAEGDGVTDDAAAFRAMINAIPARGGRVQLMSKTYLINSSIIVNKPIIFVGNGMGDSTLTISTTKIITTASNLNLFNVVEDRVSFSGISFLNQQSGTPSSGSAIRLDSNYRTNSFVWGFTLADCEVKGFYDLVDLTNAVQWRVRDCDLWQPVRYGIYVACRALPDGGDSYISGCDFSTRGSWADATSAIYQESSGGLRITNCKINNGPIPTSQKYKYGYLGVINAATTDLLITGTSFENIDSTGISVSKTTTGDFGAVTVTGCEFAMVANYAVPIKILGIPNAAITGNAFHKYTNDTAIYTNTAPTTITGNSFYNGYIKPIVGTNQTLPLSSNSVFDISNDELGIGTTTPSYPIQAVTSTNKTTIASQNTSSTGQAEIAAINNNGKAAFLKSWGSAIGTSNLNNQQGFGAENGIIIFSDAALLSGGTDGIALSAGGYTTSAYQAYVTKTGVNVGLGVTSASTSALQTTSFATGYITTATYYTATAADHTIEVTATGQAITLPTAVGITGREYVIKLTATGSCTVNTTSSQTIDGATTYSLTAQYKYVTVQSNGTNWIVIGNN